MAVTDAPQLVPATIHLIELSIEIGNVLKGYYDVSASSEIPVMFRKMDDKIRVQTLVALKNVVEFLKTSDISDKGVKDIDSSISRCNGELTLFKDIVERMVPPTQPSRREIIKRVIRRKRYDRKLKELRACNRTSYALRDQNPDV